VSAYEDLTNQYGSESEHWHGLLAAFAAEIRREAAVTVRGMTPKYLDNEVDAAIFRALDAAAAAVTKPGKEH
jgi:hypothetical protein